MLECVFVGEDKQALLLVSFLLFNCGYEQGFFVPVVCMCLGPSIGSCEALTLRGLVPEICEICEVSFQKSPFSNPLLYI